MLSQADNYDGAPGTWLGVNGDKRAAEQSTTPPPTPLLSLVNFDTGKN